MQFFHRTSLARASSILRDGFKDATGRYLTNIEYTGVWISDRPLDINEGADGDTLLEVRIDEALVIDYEWVDEGNTYREFLVPAKILNQFAKVKILVGDY